MTLITDLTETEVEGIKLALSHLIDEGDLEGAISILETSIEFVETETGGIRRFMFQALFSTVYDDKPAVSNRRLH